MNWEVVPDPTGPDRGTNESIISEMSKVLVGFSPRLFEPFSNERPVRTIAMIGPVCCASCGSLRPP